VSSLSFSVSKLTILYPRVLNSCQINDTFFVKEKETFVNQELEGIKSVDFHPGCKLSQKSDNYIIFVVENYLHFFYLVFYFLSFSSSPSSFSPPPPPPPPFPSSSSSPYPPPSPSSSSPPPPPSSPYPPPSPSSSSPPPPSMALWPVS